MPEQHISARFVRATGEDFVFTIKLHSDLTHRFWREDAPASLIREHIKQFLQGIKPLTDSGKLRCLLAQFPHTFMPSDNAFAYVSLCHELTQPIPLAVEFRHKDWACEDTVEFLKKEGIIFCIPDEPDIGSLMPFYPALTSDIAYLRLHGRNKNWFKAEGGARYDYNYTDEELLEIADTVQKLSRKSKDTFVFFNNCHNGQAAKNALRMMELLGIRREARQRELF